MNKNWFKEKLSAILLSIFTVIYMLIVLDFMDIQIFKDLKPNEKGDFLAGAFAPLAFLWLVFGYLQQGKELQLNTEALRLQVKELNDNVQQQKELVQTAKDELALIQNKDTRQIKLETIQAQPYFHIDDLLIFAHKFDNETFIQINLKFKNSRTLCRSLFLLYSLDDSIENHLITEGHFDIVENDHNEVYPINLYLSFNNSNLVSFPKKIHLNFNYTDLYDDLQIQTLSVTLGDNVFDNNDDFTHQWTYKSFSH